MSEKTKALLDKLNKITEDPAKPKWQPPAPSIPDTNRMWKSTMDPETYTLPKSYDKDKWTKVEEDGDVDEWIAFDRVYGGLGGQKLINKDGTDYQGKLTSKQIIVPKRDGSGNMKQSVTVTADGRWFNNSGMPIEKPSNVEEDAQ
tara:strand:- start:351 stop:785 length:435 start_codon:yes stop_codon:yes gene_type:complete